MAEPQLRVFCLEGEWLEYMDHNASLRGLLEMLRSWRVIDDFIFRDVATRAEFYKFAKLWAEEYEDYALAYFASHGGEAKVWLDPYDEDAAVSFEQLGDLLRARCHGRVIHIGGCSTLATRRTAIRDLLNNTGARAICGYTTDVDTMEAAALEMLLLTALGPYRRLSAGLDVFLDPGPENRAATALRKTLGFEIWELAPLSVGNR